MAELVLTRFTSSDQGTLGRLCGHGPRGPVDLATMELPWRDNARNASRIPAGVYACRLTRSPRFGLVYQVREVPDRSHILIHTGNLAGDTERGYLTHSHGCILPGRYAGSLSGQRAALASRFALSELMAALFEEPFTLRITETCR